MTTAPFEIRVGDCIKALRAMPNSSVDSIVTDPPYGLSFMGKRWDCDVPSVEIWAECLRVLKPGGHLLAFASTRTQHRMAVRIEDAGFEIRDMIGWMYGSGFPKSHNGEWGGTALKPAFEPITMARKPLIGTVAANVLAHGTGALNIDGCRVRPGERVPGGGNGRANHGGQFAGEYRGERPIVEAHTAGRWPANLIHDDSDEVVALFPVTGKSAGGGKSNGDKFGGGYAPSGQDVIGYGDTGSAARFFYCAKASKKDRGEGNAHPTVKPTDLMAYLCRLVTPPGGVVLDPFMGSGSTGKAAMLEGLRFIGVELSPEYAQFARERIALACHEAGQ